MPSTSCKANFTTPLTLCKKCLCFPMMLHLNLMLRPFNIRYSILSFILIPNSTKIGFSICNKCTFCQSDLETLHHLLYSCPHSKTFWNEFEQYWFSITKQRICLTKEDIIVGIIIRSCPLLNYLLIIAKLYLWDCRRNQTLPNVMAFKCKVQLK